MASQASHHTQHAAMSQGAPPPPGPPYPPQAQSLGEVPGVIPDVPVNVIFLCLFLAVGISHAVLLRRSISGERKFFISGMVAAFCFTRVIATTMRIVWACQPTNIQVGITAMIFVYAGIPILFIANLFFTQRLVRAQHPLLGWTKPFSVAIPALIVLTVATILCLIVAVIVSFYTLDAYARNATRDVQRYGATMLAIIASLPLVIAGVSSSARRLKHIRMTKTTDKFGEGSMRVKVAIVLVSSAFLSLGAWYRAGTVLASPVPLMLSTIPPRPAPHPAYLSKTCFYIFDFTIEICVCIFWLVMRIDKRFFVPERAQGPFSYAGGFVFAGEAGNEKSRVSHAGDNLSQNGKTPLRRSSLHSRVSWAGSLSSQSRASKLENRISWGGVSSQAVKPGMGEDCITTVPYPDGDVAADVAVEGTDKEMGWDPKSGKWAVRPISRASSHRPLSFLEDPQPMIRV